MTIKIRNAQAPEDRDEAGCNGNEMYFSSAAQACVNRGIQPSGNDALDSFMARSSDIAECEDCAEMPGEECCPEHS